MKKLVVLTMILAFAGNLIAQQAPAPGPAAQQKHDDGKKHHHHHHGHDHKDDHKDDHKK